MMLETPTFDEIKKAIKGEDGEGYPGPGADDCKRKYYVYWKRLHDLAIWLIRHH
jgi:hypothetical protein